MGIGNYQNFSQHNEKYSSTNRYARAFIHNKKILDGVIMENKLIDSRKRARPIFKIDMEKAYDHVELGFVK